MKIYKTLLQLDGATLKSDSKLTRLIKRKILKPIGYYFRKKNFNKYYANQHHQQMYLDWVNNFLTIERFACYYRITEKKAKKIINKFNK
jgi:hypothetical protein